MEIWCGKILTIYMKWYNIIWNYSIVSYKYMFKCLQHKQNTVQFSSSYIWFIFMIDIHQTTLQSCFKILVQVSSVAQSYLCDLMNLSTPGLPVHYQLPESTQTHVHWDGNAIQPSHLLSSPLPPAFNLSQHQGLYKWVCSSHEMAKVLEFQLQHQFFQWTSRTDLL